ncbi:MAG: hypothetical protein H6698_07310 [Myxococcales bacterium]|nr:hypothetical protein [Myxococcales bacterium]MCB9534114.1 hypothetical protein [Myxococcales bacterium]
MTATSRRAISLPFVAARETASHGVVARGAARVLAEALAAAGAPVVWVPWTVGAGDAAALVLAESPIPRPVVAAEARGCGAELALTGRLALDGNLATLEVALTDVTDGAAVAACVVRSAPLPAALAELGAAAAGWFGCDVDAVVAALPTDLDAIGARFAAGDAADLAAAGGGRGAGGR